jgi:hypothetical protein
MDPELQKALFESFPTLWLHPLTVTSPASSEYNCIAYAAGRPDTRWWPEENSWWPPELPLIDTMDNFLAAFTLLRYESCDNGDLEDGFEKICFYAVEGDPQHAARQRPSGEWTSKLGEDVDIVHTLAGLAGDTYGNSAVFMKRAILTASGSPSPAAT